MAFPSWDARSRAEGEAGPGRSARHRPGATPSPAGPQPRVLLAALVCAAVSGAGCGRSPASATLAPPPLPRATTTTSSAPTPTPPPTPVGLPAGADGQRIATIEARIAALRAAPPGTATVFTDATTGSGQVRVTAPGSAGAEPGLTVRCSSACPPPTSTALLGYGFAATTAGPAAPSEYSLGAVPGSDHQIAVFVERLFLEALGAPVAYRLSPG